MVETNLDLAQRIAHGFWLPGADLEDVRQEAAIGLFYAALDYEPGSRVPFRAFAALCIRRQLSTALKKATRLSQRALNDSTRLRPDGEDEPGIDPSDPRAAAAFEVIEEREAAEQLIERLSEVWWHGLTELERESMILTASEWPYREVAGFLEVSPKAVDNALQRAARKLRRAA